MLQLETQIESELDMDSIFMGNRIWQGCSLSVQLIKLNLLHTNHDYVTRQSKLAKWLTFQNPFPTDLRNTLY